MLRHHQYTRERLSQLADRISAKIYSATVAIENVQVSAPVDRISHDEAQKLEFRPVVKGEQFGPRWTTFWFRVQATVPAEWRGRVDLQWISFSEVTLWINGQSTQGLNHEPTSWDGATRPDAVLLRDSQGGESVEFMIEMACNGMFGDSVNTYKTIYPYILDVCELRLFDPEAWKLYYDFHVLQQLELEEKNDLDKTWAGALLAGLNRVANILDVDDRATWPQATAILDELYQSRNATTVHELSAIGHAHIDTAWLWPMAETWRKCERSFSTADSYMIEYSEYKFSCSQACQYEVIQQKNPDLYRRIKARVASGQWIPVGGTWIEPDCNIPSGESLCRQFLLGQRFFEREFGQRCREFWNPDVFGYNGQLPQIMRQSGITRFLTQKLSWNRFNKPDHHTFNWQGIDGSEVLAHFPPADTYNAIATVAQLRENARNYKDHDRSRHSLMLFGFGDGGGGPTKKMLETLRRARDLQGLPRTQIRSSDEFFELLENDITDRPIQKGELYFEYHRGTYTTQAATKLGNRRGEFLLHDIEFLSTLALRNADFEYSKDEIDAVWKLLCLNQFHDILPGSSITPVYEDAARDYAQIQSDGNALRERALQSLAGSGDDSIVFNTQGFARREVVENAEGALVCVEAPSYGIGKIVSTSDEVTLQESENVVLENAQLRAEFGRNGVLRSLIEKSSGRESLSGDANVFQIFDDHPTAFDAWDVDPFHLETEQRCAPATGYEVVRADDLRVEIAFEYSIGEKSSLRQTVRLDAASQRLEFHCTAQWHESHKMLKVAFPINARALHATYEMPFGIVERPTHFNTSHDLAKYEVPMHKWFDFGEHNFGVAILNDCKYGGSTHGDTMRLSLLRAPKDPDPQADMGAHAFAFAVLPHVGGWREAGIVAQGFAFNAPLLWARGDANRLPNEYSFASVESADLVLDTIKKAEDSDDIVVRMYETHGARGVTNLRVDAPFGRAVRCNILEDEGEELAVRDGVVEIAYAPFEIIGVKLKK